MKVLAWNIRQGGGKRLAAIAGAIAAHQPDAVIINELRARTAPMLTAALAQAGLAHAETTRPTGMQNGILVACRVAMRRLRRNRAAALLPHAFLEVEIPRFGTIGAVYGPLPGQPWATFWDKLVVHAHNRASGPYLFIGDFNTGEAGVDAYKKSFGGSHQFLAIRAAGFTDLWRSHNEGTEPTWYSFGRGGVRMNGFRIDHALASADLSRRAKACRYSHAERDDHRLSDHSVLLVEFSASAT